MKIFWCVKWCFVGDDGLKTIYTCMDKRCDEEELLGTLLKKLLDPLKNIKALEKYYKMDIDKDVNVRKSIDFHCEITYLFYILIFKCIF